MVKLFEVTILLASKNDVRKLGGDLEVFFQDLNILWTSFYPLSFKVTLKTIFGPGKDAENIIHAFVTSRLAYCNSLLSRSPNSWRQHTFHQY